MTVRPLDQHPLLPARQAVAVAGAVAAALGELHEAGLVHGGLAPHRVQFDAETGEVALLPADEPIAAEALPSHDVAALATFLDWLAERAPDRPAHRRGGLLRVPHPVELLVDMAHRCRTGSPSARSVADTLVHRLPDAHLPESAPPHDDPRRLVPARRLLLGVVAMVTFLVVAAASTCSATAGAGGNRRPVASEPSTDGVVVVEGERYAVGDPGDHVLVDRWSCGPPRVALLRHATGEVVAFDRLPAHDDEPVAGRVLARTGDADHLLARRTADGCAHLAVARRGGRTVPLAWEEGL